MFLSLVPSSARAQIDANNNGISDLYEKSVNGGATFPTTGSDALPGGKFHPLSDPDGDGVLTRDEAIFATDCFSPLPPAGLFRPTLAPPDPADPTRLGLTFPSVRGKRYTPETSPDLANPWNALQPLDGTGAELGFAIATPDYPRNFVRLRVADLFSDNDPWNDWEEILLGTDPFHPDTDRDGIPDHLDPLPLESATLASPDAAGLDPALKTNLRAFYDFETATGIGTVYPTIPDRSGNNRHATTFLDSIALPGIPSKACDIGATWLRAPVSAVQTHSNMTNATWTISGWFRMEEKSLTEASVDASGQSFSRALYAIYERTSPIGANVKGGKGHGLFLRKTNAGETWFLGTYVQSVLSNGNPTTTLAGANYSRPLGTSDDGRWHHFAVTRNTGSNGSKLYLDGQLVLTTPVLEQTLTYTSANTQLTFGRLYSDEPVFWGGRDTAFLDRVRVHGRVLTAAEVLAYYRQDIDKDGLWDVTETSTYLWRDRNSNAIRERSEFQFTSDPYRWQDTAVSDADGDGLLDIEEQTLGTHIGSTDTDGDLLPDKWEVENNLNPRNPNGADGREGDPDGDGWTNIAEYRYATGARNPATGGPPPIPADERVSIRLAIGDQSGSESEDYSLHCYEIQDNGTEKRVYTLRSGGFGQYVEETQNLFKKGRTYTFQIQWNGTNNDAEAGNTYSGTPAEGADYDYTFNVQPMGNHGGILIDSYDPQTKTIDETKPLLAIEANDVAETKDEFETKFQNRRVLFLSFQLVTPAGDPVSSPVAAGAHPAATPDGANEFTFNDAPVGVLTMQLKAKVPGLSLLPAAEQAKFSFEVDAIGASGFAWSGADGAGNATVNGETLTATAIFTGLPQNNTDFGSKIVRLKYGATTVRTANCEVFYNAMAKNHPAGDVSHPNWFHYYKQNEGGNDYTYDEEASTSHSLPGRPNSIKIADNAYTGGTYIQTVIESGQLKATGFSGQYKYYQYFFGVVHHERQHARNETTEYSLDPDRDFLPSDFESQTSKTAPNVKFSSIGSLIGPAYDDGEVYAGGPIEEFHIKTANTSGDWANPGTNSKQ